MQVEAAQRDPSRFADLYDQNFYRVYAYIVRRVGDRPEALDLTAGIQEAQDDLHRLYEEVRNYAAPILLERRPCPLREVLREAWGHLEPQWRGRQVRLWEHGLRAPSCEADRFRLGQVFE